MSKRNIIISVVLACLLVTGAGFGAFYYWGTHHLDSVVPGKVYQYSSSLNGEVNNRVMYVAFQEGGNKALVSQDRTTVVNADHFTSKDFYYQIAKGGQGEVKQKMTFKEIK